jgi:hypothetical protein
MQLPQFPKKDYFSRFSEKLIQSRVTILQHYLNFLVLNESIMKKKCTIEFLCLNKAEKSYKNGNFIYTFGKEEPGNFCKNFFKS